MFSFIVKHYANVELRERESKVVGGCPSLERGFTVYIQTPSSFFDTFKELQIKQISKKFLNQN